MDSNVHKILINLYEINESTNICLIRDQREGWFNVAPFGTCIDFCMKNID